MSSRATTILRAAVAAGVAVACFAWRAGGQVVDADLPAIAAGARDAAVDDAERRRLAARLAADGRAEATALLAELLRGPSRDLALAAVADVGGPAGVADEVESLVTADRPAATAGLAARALGRLDPDRLARRASQVAADLPVPHRRAVAAALGSARVRSVVVVLRRLLDDPAVSETAGDSLRRLSGLDRAADDRDFWLAWADRAIAGDAGAFRVGGPAEPNDADAAAVERLARDAYAAAADPDARDAMLIGFLTDSSPALRAVGVRLVLDATTFGGGADIPAAAAAAVRQHLGDPSPVVRELAARTVGARSDEAAYDEVLARLGVETDPAVRLALVDALLPLRRAGAVPALLGLLDSPSPSLRRRAARAAVRLAESAGDDAARRAVAERLARATVEADVTTAAGRARRLEAVEALGELRDPRLSGLYLDLLRRPRAGADAQSPELRAAVLRGVATLGDAQLADAVVPSLADPDPRVREAAVTALASGGGFERAQQVARFLDAPAEPDPSVRRAAWRAFERLIPLARDVQLAGWPDRLADPRHRLAVLRDLARRAESRGDGEGLAARRGQMAEVLLALPDGAAEAAGLLEQALDHTLTTDGPTVVVVTRTRQALRAYVNAGLIDDAARLAGRVVADRPSAKQDVGSALKREAERLVEAGDLPAARGLIAAALALPLDRTSERNLRDLRSSIGGG